MCFFFKECFHMEATQLAHAFNFVISGNYLIQIILHGLHCLHLSILMPLNIKYFLCHNCTKTVAPHYFCTYCMPVEGHCVLGGMHPKFKEGLKGKKDFKNHRPVERSKRGTSGWWTTVWCTSIVFNFKF